MRLVSTVVLSIVILIYLVGASGCNSIHSPGETSAEGHRRHMRMVNLETQMIWADIDAVLYTDETTRLADLYLR